MNVTKTTRVNIAHQIDSVNVNLNYEFVSAAPETINVNANFSSDGMSASLYRNYKQDGSCTPAIVTPVGPFDATFNTALAALIAEVFTHYNEAEVLETV